MNIEGGTGSTYMDSTWDKAVTLEVTELFRNMLNHSQPGNYLTSTSSIAEVKASAWLSNGTHSQAIFHTSSVLLFLRGH